MANGNFGGGNGTAATPYLVEDLKDLLAIGNKATPSTGLYFKQIADIDLSEYTTSTSFPKIRCTNAYASNSTVFMYDGGGYKILNLTQLQDDSNSNTNFGLFECYSGSYNNSYANQEYCAKFIFKNINMVNVNISGRGGSPILAPPNYYYQTSSSYGFGFNIEVENCFVSGKMTLMGNGSCDASCFIPGKILRYSSNHPVYTYPTVKNCTAVMQVNITSTTTGTTTFGGALGNTQYATSGSYHVKMVNPMVINTAIHAEIHAENVESGVLTVAGLVAGSTSNLVRSYVNASFDLINTGEGTINGYYFGTSATYKGSCIANHEKGGLENYSADSLHFLTDEQMKTASYYERLGWWI